MKSKATSKRKSTKKARLGALGSGKYPCDDSYQRGKERVAVYVTYDRHFDMPSKVSSLSQLKRLKGVGKIEKERDSSY